MSQTSLRPQTPLILATALILQTKLLLATILQRYSPRVKPGYTLQLQPRVTIRPRQ